MGRCIYSFGLARNSDLRECFLALLAGLSLVLTAVSTRGDEDSPRSPAVPTPGLLREDQRLQATLTVDLVKPTLQDILDRLSAATGLKITAADDIPPDRLAFWSLSVHKIPAWMVMADLRDTVVRDGQWECQGDGWRLTGVVAPPIEVEKRVGHNRNRQALLRRATLEQERQDKAPEGACAQK